MASFSIGEAVNSGLRIIRDHPTAVLVWSLAYFVILMLPQFAVVGMLWNSFSALASVAEQSTGDKPSPEVMQAAGRLQASMSIIQLIQFGGSLLWASLFFGAVYRAVLEPQSQARWFVRLSKQELWLGLVLAVAYVLLILTMFAGMIPLVLYAAIVSTVGKMGGADWPGVVLLAFAVAGVICWAAIRLSLATAMSFAERNFRLFESWSLTRGHALRMFLTFLAVFALVLGLEMAVVAVIGIVVVAIALSFPGPTGLSTEGAEAAMQALVDHPLENWIVLAIAAAVVGGLVLSVVSTALTTIMIAPLASIYRQLTAQAPAAA